MSQPDFDQARRYALGRLERELHPGLRYHSIGHTCDEVAPAASRIARLEGVGASDTLLLLTAAYFHDLGFVERREEHEAAGVRIAEVALPAFGYTAAQIQAIGAIIMATRLPQSPSSPLGAILADSDLDTLGRPDFLERNRLLRAEVEAFGEALSDAQWYRRQIQFAQAHTYWTPSARALRGVGKAHNIRLLKDLLATCEEPAADER